MTSQRKQLSDDEWLWEQEVLQQDFTPVPPPRVSSRRDTVTVLTLVITGAFVLFGGTVYTGWQLIELIRGFHL